MSTVERWPRSATRSVGASSIANAGGIVLMSSLVAFQGVPRAANYAATKAYVQSFAEALRLELKPLGVDVIASAPGSDSQRVRDAGVDDDGARADAT